MLQKLNERLKGVVAWVIIILIAFTFTLFGVEYYLQSQGRDDGVVGVNGESISRKDYETQYRRVRQNQDLSNYTAAKDSALKKQVLDKIIENEVSVQSAKKNGFLITNNQANAAITAIPQFQEKGKFSLQRYQQAISGAAYTAESFLRQVKQGMLLNQVRFAVIGTAFVLPSEVKRFVKLSMQTRDYDYLLIPYKDALPGIKVSDDEIVKYYQQHKQEFMTSERVAVEFLRLSMKNLRQSIKITQDEIERFYKDNIGSFQVPAKWKVAQIYFSYPKNANEKQREQVKGKAQKIWKKVMQRPSDFSNVLKKETDDKLSLINKGALPWITAGQTFMDSALVTLKNKGDISKPLESSNGVQIFQLIEYKPTQTKPFSAVKADIKNQLLSDKVQSIFSKNYETLAELAFQTPDSLESVSEALKLPIETSSVFSRKGLSDGIARYTKIVEAAFTHDVLSLGNNSEPVQTNNEEVIVLRIKQHFPAKERPLQKVADEIKAKLAKQKAKNKVAKIGKRLAFKKQTLQQAIKSNAMPNLQWKKVANASRDESGVDPSINELAFEIGNSSGIKGKLLNNGNYALVSLKNIHDGELTNLDAEQKRALARQLESNFGLMDYDLYLASILKQAQIELPNSVNAKDA